MLYGMWNVEWEPRTDLQSLLDRQEEDSFYCLLSNTCYPLLPLLRLAYCFISLRGSRMVLYPHVVYLLFLFTMVRE